MNYSICDVETNGLLDTATKIHCMSVNRVRDGVSTKFTLVTYDEMRAFLREEDCIIGHNFKRFDGPALEKFLHITIKARVIDTLFLSWYLYPLRKQHGIEFWGRDLGVEKPVITDWDNQSLDDYVYRCEQDVEINTLMFDLQISYLKAIYDNDSGAINRIIDYLMFKADCSVEQEDVRWKLDVAKCESNLAILTEKYEEKAESLSNIMPPHTKYEVKSRPKIMFKKDGSLSVHGQNWIDILNSLNLPHHHIGAVKVPKSVEKGNPRSHDQLKSWLFSLGWQPDNYKYVKEKDGSQRKVPQVSNADGNDVSESVKVLYEKVPELEQLEEFFILNHRISLLKGFLENKSEDGYLIAQIKGLTNTLRFQHTTIVNLPTIPKPYWEMIRGCLIAEKGCILCGSDMSSLEDNTKQHYMMYFDPEYVQIMRTPGFSPHLYIAVVCKKISHDEMEFYKWYDNKKDGKEYTYYPPIGDITPTGNSCLEGDSKGLPYSVLINLPEEEQARIFKVIKPIRLKSKKVNFAAVYGAGVAKIVLTSGMPHSEAKEFHTTYWKVNRSVKEIAAECIVKRIGEQMWLYNPVSRFWYSLRADKDRFSTLNQGTGVYCFDTWVSRVVANKLKYVGLTGQFHDEVILKLPDSEPCKEELVLALRKSIEETNAILNLNVPLGISIDFGYSYADIH